MASSCHRHTIIPSCTFSSSFFSVVHCLAPQARPSLSLDKKSPVLACRFVHPPPQRQTEAPRRPPSHVIMYRHDVAAVQSKSRFGRTERRQHQHSKAPAWIAFSGESRGLWLHTSNYEGEVWEPFLRTEGIEGAGEAEIEDSRYYSTRK